MPDRCVVGGCSKVANFSSDWSAVVALHKFPTASSVRQSWIAFVRQRRPGWIFVPSARICSNHFTDDCFANKSQYLIAAAESVSKGDSKLRFMLVAL